MSLPIMKIYTAIKDDYQNLRLEQGNTIWVKGEIK